MRHRLRGVGRAGVNPPGRVRRGQRQRRGWTGVADRRISETLDLVIPDLAEARAIIPQADRVIGGSAVRNSAEIIHLTGAEIHLAQKPPSAEAILGWYRIYLAWR
jgi:hypothetical protein